MGFMVRNKYYRILLSALSLVLVGSCALALITPYTNLQAAQDSDGSNGSGGSNFEANDVVPYNFEDTIYEMDFSDSNVRTYSRSDGWTISSVSSLSIEDGKLYCKDGDSFTFGTRKFPGDMYGVRDYEFKFDMALASGTFSVGTRLILNGDVSSLSGLWFSFNGETLRISEPSGRGREVIDLDVDITAEHTYRFVDTHDYIHLYIDDTLTASVEYTADTWQSLAVEGVSATAGELHPHETLPVNGYITVAVTRCSGYVDNCSYNSAVITSKLTEGSDRDIDYSLWTAIDDLDRVVPDATVTGDVREDKYVGVFYFLSHTFEAGRVVRDYTRMYLESGLDGLKQHLNTSDGGHWAEPYFGYYLSNDTWVHRKHAEMLSAAGVDFIFLDMSNAIVYTDQHVALFDTWLQIRKEGGTTPQIVCMTGDMPSTAVIDLFSLKDSIFDKPEYDELLFKWEGKPLLFANTDTPDGDSWTVASTTPQSKDSFYDAIASQSSKLRTWYESGEYTAYLEKFTVRKCWAWQAQNYNGYWNWLDTSPQTLGTDANGKIEQISVTMGQHAHTNTGRSMLNADSSYDKGQDFGFGLTKSGVSAQGLLFAEQFEYALKQDPSVIMITGWNVW